MIILRQKSFSKEENDKGFHSAVKGAALVGTGIASNKGLISNIKINKEGDTLKRRSKKTNKKLVEEHKKISEILKREAEAQGTKVTETNNGVGSHYISKNSHKINKMLGARVEEAGKAGDSILTENRADLLAHELGHSKHYQRRSGSKIGKLAHRLYTPSIMGTTSKVGLSASLINGAISGQNSVKAEKEGKKESKWNKARAVAVPAMIGAPILVAEGAASREGLKLLKKAGASKELLRDSKKNLLKSHGTYTSNVAINVGAGELGRAAGKFIEQNDD